VPELAVGEEFAAGEQRRADAGAESQHDHRAAAAAPATETHLGEAGGIRVIQEQYGRASAREASAAPLVPSQAVSILAAVWRYRP